MPEGANWLSPAVSDAAPSLAAFVCSSTWEKDPDRALDVFRELTTLVLPTTCDDGDYRTGPTLARPGGSRGVAIVHRTAVVHPGTALVGDVFIASDCELGPNATVFGPTVIGPGSYVGPNAEIRRSVLLQDVKASHACYLGHSVIGRQANIAAQTVTAVRNLKRKTVHILVDGVLRDTELELFGALIGDEAQFGCDVTIMPGRRIGVREIVGPRTLVMHNVGL